MVGPMFEGIPDLTCPDCNGAGYVLVQNPEFASAEADECLTCNGLESENEPGDLERESLQIAKSGSFADLQARAAMALAWQDIAGARAAIRAMKEFVAMAERDLEKLIAWTRSSEETLR